VHPGVDVAGATKTEKWVGGQAAGPGLKDIIPSAAGYGEQATGLIFLLHGGPDSLEKIAASGEFRGRPIATLGSADGKTAYVAFADLAEVAAVDLESQAISYIPATDNGSAAFTVGLSNNVCH
jgi:hypothetical protein